jgi:hypothetical protein
MTKKERWDLKIQELEDFFNSCIFPKEPVKLSVCETIIDCKSFVKSHLDIVKANPLNKTYYPYVKRLTKFKEMMEKN